jgi:Domain of Unknown Function (DUF928)
VRSLICPKIYLSLVLSLIFCGLPTSAYSQFSPPSVRTAANSRIKFKAPPRRGLPVRREPGGSRRAAIRSCVASGNSLTILLPPDNLGLTTNPYPRFFWYTPNNTAVKAEFSLYKYNLKTNERNLVYRTPLKPSNIATVESFQLPQHRQPLAINQLYLWSVSLSCSSQNDQTEVGAFAEGWVERVALRSSVARQIEKLDLQSRLPIYAERGLWLDLLTTLAQLRACRPQDGSLSEITTDLFQQVQLTNIAPLFDNPKLIPQPSKRICFRR